MTIYIILEVLKICLTISLGSHVTENLSRVLCIEDCGRQKNHRLTPRNPHQNEIMSDLTETIT